jgi:hypothetical protein
MAGGHLAGSEVQHQLDDGSALHIGTRKTLTMVLLPGGCAHTSLASSTSADS